jgi:hypothetical protein
VNFGGFSGVIAEVVIFSRDMLLNFDVGSAKKAKYMACQCLSGGQIKVYTKNAVQKWLLLQLAVVI